MEAMPAMDEGHNGSEVGIPDELWAGIALLLPPVRRKTRKGRPRMGDRQAMVAILFRLRTGCSWKALPRGLGAGSTVHDRFQEWRRAGLFERMWQAGLLGQDEFELTAAPPADLDVPGALATKPKPTEDSGLV